jgi:putative ABC transport system substrate-binding protein
VNRRGFVIAIGAGALALPGAAAGQSSPRVWRIGFLRAASFTEIDTPLRDALLQAFRELGYVEGKNLHIEWRFAGGSIQRLNEQAVELVQAKVDVIMAAGGPGGAAAKAATSRIPIVLVNTADPEVIGLVKSLARPGGNITGTSNLTGQLGSKNLEMLAGLIPRLQRVALLLDPANAVTPTIVRDVAFLAMSRQDIRAVILAAGGLFRAQLRQIAELAIRYGIATASNNQDFPMAGILLSYSSDFVESFRRSASYVDRILRGAKPGDLPIEQPTKLELTINLKTAKALGITIPQSILVRASRVIE